MTIPASVTILDLATASVATTSMAFEASYTTASGNATTVQVLLSQIATTTFGGLPTGGATGQILQKASAANFSTSWNNIANAFAAGTGITLSGSTTVTIEVNASITSLFSVAGGTSITVTPSGTSFIVGVTNGGIGSTQLGALAVQQSNITAAAVGSTQLGALAVQRTNITAAAVGSTQLDSFAVIQSKIATNAVGPLQLATFAVVATSIATGAVGSTQLGALAVQSSNITSFAVFSSHIATSQVTYEKIQNVTGLSIIGNVSTAVTTVAAITATAGGQIPITNPAGTTILWQSISTSLDQTLGSTPGVLAFRNATSWTTIASTSIGGSLVLLTTLTPTSVASAIFDGTAFTATYRNLVVKINTLVPSAVSAALQMQIGTSGTAIATGGLYVSQIQAAVNGTIVLETFTTAFQLSGARATTIVDGSAAYGVNGQVQIFTRPTAAAGNGVISQIAYPTGSLGTATYAMATMNGVWDGNLNAFSALRFQFSTGSISTGVIRIYGMT